MGRPRLSAEEKKRRGTFRASAERYYQAEAALVGRGLVPTGGDPEDPGERLKIPDPVPPRDYAAIAHQYALDVVRGSIVACKWVELACARQIGDLARQTDPFWPYLWEPATGADACHFAECCPHVEGQWDAPTIGLEPWQVFIVMCLFGWRHKGDRTRRRFTNLYLEVGRKAAKSTLIAVIAFYHLLREGELGASVICAATTGQQARMVFGIMQKMGRRSMWLRAQGVEVFANSISTGDGGARPVNAKATSLDGLNPSCIVLDESHAQDFGLHDVLKSAQGARANPLMLCPTTAGYDLLSVGYALRGQVTKVLAGVFAAEHLLGVIYTLDDEDDWRDPAVWIKANPMLGISPKLDYVRQYCADAQQAPELEGEFKVKVCSLWSHSASAWLSVTAWDRCADATLKIADFEGEECVIGGDLAQVDDMAAVVLEFRREGVSYAFLRCYLPVDVVEERARLVPAYRQWVKDGLLVMTEGAMTDVDRIQADIEADCLRFKVKQVVFDQFGSAQLAARLAAKGIPAIVEPKNARTATPPARDLEARVKHQRFRHEGNALFRWFASNAVVRRGVDDSLLPKKENAESPNKIDGIDALVSALGARIRLGGNVPTQEPRILVIGGKR